MSQTPQSVPARRGFTLVELMVVIVIIVLLIGILLPVIHTAYINGKEAATRIELQSIVNASLRYRLDQGAWPGVVSDQEIASDPTLQRELTSTENLLLALTGVVVPAGSATTPWTPSVVPPSMAGREVDLDRIGRGPITRGGHKIGAYITPEPSQLFNATGTLGSDNNLPDLVDSWRGLPLLALRAQRSASTTAIAADSGPNAVFLRNTVRDYTEAAMLKSSAGDVFNQRGFSGLSAVAVGAADANDNLAWVATDPRISSVTPGVSASANNADDVPRGDLVLIAAGSDEFYFAKDEFDEYPAEDTFDSYEDLKKTDDIVVVGN